MKTVPFLRFVLAYVFLAVVVFALGVLFDRFIPPYHSWEHDLRYNLGRAMFLPLLIFFIQRRFKDQRR